MPTKPEPVLGPILQAVLDGFKNGAIPPPPGPDALFQGVLRVNGATLASVGPFQAAPGEVGGAIQTFLAPAPAFDLSLEDVDPLPASTKFLRPGDFGEAKEVEVKWLWAMAWLRRDPAGRRVRLL